MVVRDGQAPSLEAAGGLSGMPDAAIDFKHL
jgi:hypothetical protein